MTSQSSAPWRLDGSVAVVTGAARGIGAAIARQLAGLGASLALADLEAIDPAEQARQLRSLGRRGSASTGSTCATPPHAPPWWPPWPGSSADWTFWSTTRA